MQQCTTIAPNILPPSQNKYNSRTEYVNQYQMQITKLPLVFCKKNLDIGLSFVQKVSGDSCLLLLLSQNCILCGINFKPQNCIYFGTEGVLLKKKINIIVNRLTQSQMLLWFFNWTCIMLCVQKADTAKQKYRFLRKTISEI